MGPDTDNPPSTLRRCAEEQLTREEDGAPLLQMDAQRVMHELRIQQIELEIQDDALHSMSDDAVAAQRRFADLNDRLHDIEVHDDIARRAGDANVSCTTHTKRHFVAVAAASATSGNDLRSATPAPSAVPE